MLPPQADGVWPRIRAAMGLGDWEQAEELCSHAESDMRARLVAELAVVAPPNRAHRLLCNALTLGHWTASLDGLAHVYPEIVSRVANDYDSLAVRDHIGRPSANESCP